ncbi:MAG: M81 family metallopeptidase [Gammaproteobacteria bacterium]
MRALRVAVGGVQHETNTFADTRAAFADFAAADAWPGLTRGRPVFEAVRGINLPIAGFIEEARRSGHELAPLSWCSAQPSGSVTRDAFERIASMLLEDLRAQLPLDAVYLDLHGAMVAEHLDDADGELLRRVRGVVGDSVPLIASLDLHANVSAAMVAAASLLVGYRTYPHVDMAETGARAARALPRLAGRPPLARARRALDFLIPLTWQCTLVEPTKALMQRAIDATRDSIVALEFTPGFPLADVADAGPCVFGYGEDHTVEHAVDQLAVAVAASEQQFAGNLWSIDAAVERALSVASVGIGPVILVDTQDNPGAGGNADTMALIKAFIARGAESVVAGLICDEAVARAAHATGKGRTLRTSLGAKSGWAGESPVEAEFVIEALGDGKFTGTGPFYLGTRMELGPMALLRIGGVRIAVASRKQQAADQAMFRHLGVEPAGARILVLKSSVHFRADFGPLASDILVVEAPGPSPADPARLPFRKLRPGVRL